MLAALTSPLVHAGTTAVRLLSRVRGERVIHSRGHTLSARLVVPGGAGTGAPLLDEAGTYDALLRLSRSVGLPAALPDVLGLALRVLDAHGPDAHQDLLLDSAPARPVLRRVPWPGRDFAGATYCSLLPYDVAGTHLLLGARTAAGTPVLRAPDDAGAGLSLVLLVATPHGPWQEVATMTVTGVLPAPQGRQLRFSPGTTGGGIRPAGPFQSWRERSYPASHVAPDER